MSNAVHLNVAFLDVDRVVAVIPPYKICQRHVQLCCQGDDGSEKIVTIGFNRPEDARAFCEAVNLADAHAHRVEIAGTGIQYRGPLVGSVKGAG